MKNLILIGLTTVAAIFVGCDSGQQEPNPLTSWTFSEEMIFPADRSLNRPEDGVAFADGRVIVADQIAGLRLIFADGTSRPFGKFADAGYEHNPPSVVGGPNGVTLEPEGGHILVSDVFRGGIYRVNINSEVTQKIYQHPFGVNMARADRTGGIWFTQSTENNPEQGEAELFRAVDTPTPDGALFYLPQSAAGAPTAAIKLADGLVFANGLALDENAGYLYVAETMGNRVLRYEMDVTTGSVTNPITALEIIKPDNLELDAESRLWIALPIQSEIVVFDPATTSTRSVFRVSSPASDKIIEEIELRLKGGKSWLELFSAELWEPGPGAMTGMILSPHKGPVYTSGLGNALIKLDR